MNLHKRETAVRLAERNEASRINSSSCLAGLRATPVVCDDLRMPFDHMVTKYKICHSTVSFPPMKDAVPPNPFISMRLRVTAFSLVAIVVGLSLFGTLLALRRIQSFTDHTLDQAITWARQAAEHAEKGGPSSGEAIRPSEEFIEEQRRTVMTQITVYGALTGAALLTVLVAMALLLRLARREVALSAMKSNFVADVSHELKTPLALIRMFAETLRTRGDIAVEKRNEYYAIIERESNRLTNLINNILDFAKIDAGRKEYRLQPTDVVAVVRETYASYREQLDREGFEHHLSIAEGLPNVDADRDAIVQILVNLINNAIKYSEDEKHLVIELAADTRRGKRGVLISVHDRGIGIKPEERAYLTEGFYRADDARVRQKSGTGLGLALVKHIIEAHHGSLDVESRLVKGSTFRVFLPASMTPATSVS